MFSVYGISGPIFQGTLENLGRMPPVLRRRPVIAARRIDDQLEASIIPAYAGATEATPLGGQAVEAYQSMLPKNLERGPLYHANQIMQRQIITVTIDDDLTRAWQTLVEHEIHQAPVLDRSGRLVGIISERNLLTVLNVEAGAVRDVIDLPLREVMATPVVAASPVTDIRRIAQVMLDHDVEGVPIVNEAGALVGFISHRDILRAVITDPPLSIWR